jgi:hypothetical protein
MIHWPEVLGEGDVLFLRQGLIRKDQHGILPERGLDLIDLTGFK